MTKYLRTLLFFTAATISAYGGAIVANQVYTFDGTCTDCAGHATATLTLLGTYQPGVDDIHDFFVSFHYDGTNLFGPYDIDGSNPDAGATGVIPASLPSAAGITINDHLNLGTNLSFSTNSAGLWSTGTVSQGGDDMGISHVWTAAVAGVPEPGTMGMLGIAFAGLAFAAKWRISK